MDRTGVPVALKSVTMEDGEQSVMMPGTCLMQRLCADSLGVARPLRPPGMPGLVKALEVFSWMTCSAEGTNPLCGSARTRVGAHITVLTMRMPVSSAQVLAFVIFLPEMYFRGITSKSPSGKLTIRNWSWAIWGQECVCVCVLCGFTEVMLPSRQMELSSPSDPYKDLGGWCVLR